MGPETVADGVHRIALPLPEDGLRAVNVYVIEDIDGLTLIDAGWALEESRELLDSALADLRHHVADVHDVLVTHVHRDHYTQAMWLRRDHGVRVSLGSGERPGLDRLFEIRTNVPVEAIEELRRGGGRRLAEDLALEDWAEFDPSCWGYPDRWIEDGDTFGGLEAVATPGHTRGHTVFHDVDRGLLFAGDHLLPSITPSIGFELGRPPLPLGDFLASLRRVLTRPDARLLPAHGAVAESAWVRARELLEHHRIRFDVTMAVVEDAGSTAWEVASRLRWTRHERRLEDLDGFNRMLAVCETAAHLDVLAAHGALDRNEHPGHRTYHHATTHPWTELLERITT